MKIKARTSGWGVFVGGFELHDIRPIRKKTLAYCWKVFGMIKPVCFSVVFFGALDVLEIKKCLRFFFFFRGSNDVNT